jgi:hypothetical protein
LITKLTIGLGLASIVAGPLTLAAGAGPLAPAPLAQQFGHTPSIEPFITEEAPDDLLENELVLPDAFVEGNILVIDGSRPYPVGDGFYDADGIPLGPSVTDKSGLYGYAPIQTLPGYVLMWYLDGTGRKKYMVTTADDELLTGPTGFDTMIDNLRKAEERLERSVGGGVTALGILVVSQLAGCLPSGGVLCASAVVTGLVGAIGGTIATIGIVAFDLIPAMNNVERAFTTVDVNRP